ncbi:MAG: hypothetical protein ACFFG0_15790, partial [Candidatus Thorarchaeota archaeon]
LISFLYLTQNIQTVLSSNSDNSLEIDTKFEMTEYSTSLGIYSNIDIIDFELPSPTWEIDEIELNFTNVEFGIEEKTIENNPIGSFIIEKFQDSYGYSVQIIINDPTVIYGVVIYGNNESSLYKPIYVQINGYNNTTNSPNNIVYGTPELLNMSYSLTPSWHTQTFVDPISLSEGNYYLLINGSAIGESPKSKYKWYYNNVNPNYPELNISKYNGASWTAGEQGTPFLHKLIQKVNYSFFPEEINMTAELEGNLFQISNQDHPGKGYLKKSNINYHPNNKNVKIKIKNNKTESLNFTLKYNLNINNEFLAPGFLEIRYNSNNTWSVFPWIERFSDNHTLKFNYPFNWYNILIFKNQQDITTEIFIDSFNNVIIIPNEIIENGAEWLIQASSPSTNFKLNIIKTEFVGGEVLEFSIDGPILDGIYEFKLISPLGNLKYNQKIMIPTQDNLFSYTIPENITEGNYTAYIYWYNQTDAGVVSEIFSLSLSITDENLSKDDIPIIFVVGIILIGGSVIGASSYAVINKIKKVQTKHRDKLRLILERCSDIMNVEYIIVLDKKSGIDVYSETFGEKEIDATLISGFLQAIQNFGSEVLGRAKESRTFKVEYQKYIIIMTEFVYLRLIVIMKENPSRNFLYSIESLAYDIYKDYGILFEKFNGALEEFRGIKKLLEQHLNISMLYPLVVDYSIKLKLTQEEKEMVQRAINFMHESNFNYFYVLYLLPENVCSPKDYEIIQTLIQKGIFKPIDKLGN